MKKSTIQSMKSLGNKIKIARKSIGLSQQDLARYMKVTNKTISAYEVGRTSPPLTMLKKISLIVQKPLSYFDDKATVSKEELLQKIKQIEQELNEVKKYLKTQ